MDNVQITPKKTRQYRRITQAEVVEFKSLEALHGNGSAAALAMYPTVLNKGDRAFKIRKKAETEATVDFIETSLQQIGVDAVNRLGKLINSQDEAIATRNVHYSIDHIRGQATKKSISVTAKLNIQNVLD